ncbi:hypothetical protein [Falsiroseomonas sp. HW251]|uniref:hypothetical protein n=1 Tax=Falsiroseomonas sp. HW251 TaxID=3390998 RepID=UPI003D31C475
MVRAALLLILLLAPGLALGQSRVGVRTGDHPTFGRVVFDFPRETGFLLEEEEGRVVIRFAEAAEFDLGARRLPRNARGIEAAGDSATIALAPGARARAFRLGPRVVVDLLDGTEPPPAQAEARPSPRPEPRAAAPRPAPAPATTARAAPAPAPTPQSSAPALALPSPPVAAPPLAEPAAVQQAAPVAPAPPRATPLRLQDGALVIPVAAETGAALLRRGDTWMVVLDEPLTLDPVGLRDTRLAHAELAAGPRATVLRIPAEAIARPRLRRERAAWLLDDAPEDAALRAIQPEIERGPPPRLLLRAARAAETVVVLDPETGGALLVGTMRDGNEATPRGRRAATFDILPTRLGAAILPRADTVALRALPMGFVASPGPGAALGLGADPAPDDAQHLSRLFDLPAEALPALLQRERNAGLDVAGAPPLGRGLARIRHAEALLALGLGAEAQAMATLALREDPRLAEEPRAQALQAAAALVAGRLAEAEALLNPRLPDSDEAALWRGLLLAARNDAERGAPGIAAGLPILRAWPEPLRARLAPLAAEALAEANETAAARRLVAGQDENPAFALARARLLDSSGDSAALDAYEAIARGRDRRARAIAMRRAAEMKLAAGTLDAAGAAGAMEAVLAAWRGDALESAARLRLAELRRQAGDPRGALDALRDTERLFPDLAATLRPLQGDALLAALSAEPPLSAVALFEANRNLLPNGGRTAEVLAALAERFAALDLPDRARSLLGQALARAEAPEARAAIGLRLAALALEGGDPGAARAALADTDAPGLPDALRAARALADARALARMGAAEQAVTRFREAGPEAAPELAEFLASRQDWAPAAAVLRAHLDTLAPGPLSDAARRLVARSAALLALAGDETGLAALRESHADRMAGTPEAETFDLLTAGRAGGVADLPRLRQQLELARLLPQRLETLRTAPAAAR